MEHNVNAIVAQYEKGIAIARKEIRNNKRKRGIVEAVFGLTDTQLEVALETEP
jgi:hypothetical protein